MSIYFNNQVTNIYSGIIEDIDTGTFDIINNGTFDISEYAFVSVDIDHKNYYAGNYTPDNNFGKEGELYFVIEE